MKKIFSLKEVVLFLMILVIVGLFAGCSGSSAGGVETEILNALKRDYPPDQKPGGETSNYKLFKFEPLKDKPKDAEEAWCVNFLFTNKVDANSKPARWIGFGNVVKKEGKYSYEFSQGCKLTDAEQKEVFELKSSE